MAIKVNGATVITNSRRGVFRTVNPGSYSTANRPPGASEGDVIYDTDEKTIFVWNGTEWIAAGGGTGGDSNLNPALPPFGSRTTTQTVLNSADGKVEFSLDGNSYSTSLTIPINTFYYVDWGSDILSAAHDSNYEAEVSASYPDLGLASTVEFDFKIDKMPDPFSFDDITDVDVNTQYESNIISPTTTINAPTSIWVTSDAPSFQLRVGNGTWFNPPSTIGSAYVNHREEVQIRHTSGPSASSAYTSTVFIGYGTSAGQFESSDFVTTTSSSMVNTPTLTTPDSVQPTYTSSAYSVEGAPGTHTSTDWQVATDAGFSNIVIQSLNDTSSLTSWTPYVSLNAASNQALGKLNANTTLYVRCRHNSSSGISSDYVMNTITTESLTTDFSTSFQQVQRPSTNFTSTTWTVPAGIGRVKATMYGNNRGGILVGQFDVAPGDELYVYNLEGAVGLSPFNTIDADTSANRAKLFGVVGNAGGQSSGKNSEGQGNPPQYEGGAGGSSQADRGGFNSNTNNNGSGGFGASSSGPGAGGSNANVGSVVRVPAAGSGFSGGLGGRTDQPGDAECSGGVGGSGWYGGGGGGADDDNNHGGAGGGGSSKWQTPDQSSWRSPSQTTNQKGTSTQSTPTITFEY